MHLQDCTEAVLTTCNEAALLDHSDILEKIFQLWLHIWRSGGDASYVGAKHLSTSINFMLEALKANKTDKTLCCNALRALGYLIFENGDRFTRYIGSLLPWFQYFIETNADAHGKKSLQEPVLPALVCTGNLFLRVGSKIEGNSVIHFFRLSTRVAFDSHDKLTLSTPQNTAFHLRALSSSLRAMHHIVPHLPTDYKENVSEVVHLLHQTMCFGSSGPLVDHTVNVRSFGEDQCGLADSSEGAVAQGGSPSDSQDTGSDTDGSMCSRNSGLSLSGHEQHQPVRVRIAAMQGITALCRKFPIDVRGYWHLFLPEYQALHPQPVRVSLATPLLFDSSAKVREAAAHAISAVVRIVPFAKWIGQNVTYSQIKSSNVASSSLSSRIFCVVMEVHKAIRRALQQELHKKHSSLIVSIIAALSELAATIPYSRFPSNMLTDCVPPFSSLLQQGDSSLVTPSLQCVGNMLSNKDACEALVTLMVPLHALLNGEERLKSSNGFAGSLLDCLLQLCGQETPPAIRSEVLSVISKASRHYAGAISAAWRSVSPLLVESFRDMQSSVRANALKVIEEMLRSRAADTPSLAARVSRESLRRASKHTTKVQEFELIDYFGRDLLWPWRLADQESRPAITMLDLVHQLIQRGLKDTNPLVRSSACMCVSYLMPVDWARLLASPQGVEPTETSLHLTVTKEGADLRDKLLGDIKSACYDPATSTKSAACRAFGAYSCFRDWKLFDFVQLAVPPLLHCANENTLSVRMKAIWALSNLCSTPNQVTDSTTTVATSSGLVAPTVSALKEQLQRRTPPREGDNPKRDGSGKREKPGDSPIRDASSKRERSEHVFDPPLLLSQFMSLSTLRLLVDALSVASRDADKVACAAVRTLGLCVKGLIEHMYPVDAFRVATETEESRSPPRRINYKQQQSKKQGGSTSQEEVSKLLTPPPEIKRSFDIVGSDEKALFTGGGRVPHRSTAESPFVPKKREQESGKGVKTVKDDTDHMIRSAWKAGLVPRSPGGFNLMQRPVGDACNNEKSDGNLVGKPQLNDEQQEQYNDDMWHRDHCNISKAMLMVTSMINGTNSSAKTRWNACYAIHVVLPLSQILLNAQNRWKDQFGEKISAEAEAIPTDIPKDYIVPGPSGKPCPDTKFWTQTALEECSKSLVESDNYKVKIASAQAIGSVPSRTILCGEVGRTLTPHTLKPLGKSLTSLLKALFDNVDESKPKGDEKYYATSLENIVEFSLLKCLSFCRIRDFPYVKESLEMYAEPLLYWLSKQWDMYVDKDVATELSPNRRPQKMDIEDRADEETTRCALTKAASLNVTEMFESRFKTISPYLLKKYQQKFKA